MYTSSQEKLWRADTTSMLTCEKALRSLAKVSVHNKPVAEFLSADLNYYRGNIALQRNYLLGQNDKNQTPWFSGLAKDKSDFWNN